MASAAATSAGRRWRKANSVIPDDAHRASIRNLEVVSHFFRHCEEQSDAAIQSRGRGPGLPRFAAMAAHLVPDIEIPGSALRAAPE
jgi:hypothetical protein